MTSMLNIILYKNRLDPVYAIHIKFYVIWNILLFIFFSICFSYSYILMRFFHFILMLCFLPPKNFAFYFCFVLHCVVILSIILYSIMYM